MTEYVFVTEWFFTAPIECVFAELEDAEQWPSFWKGVRKVEVLSRPPHGYVGVRSRNTWKSVLPYALTFDAEVVRHERPRLIEVAAHGELTGRGRCELCEERGGTRVVYHWHVATTRPWMNLFGPLARPVFRWNHDVVMRWGYEGFSRRLAEMAAPGC